MFCVEFALAVLLAYWTGICLTAITSKIDNKIITIHNTNSIKISIRPPLFSETLEINSCVNDSGKFAIIPTIISKDIPFPIPLSVIFSPNHMAKIVPVTKIVTDENKNNGPLPRIKALSGTPSADNPKRYAGA